MSCGQLSLIGLEQLRLIQLRKEASCTSSRGTLVSGRGDRLDRNDMMSQSLASPLRDNTVTWLMTTNFCSRSRLSEPVSVDPTLQTHPGVYLSLPHPPSRQQRGSSNSRQATVDTAHATDATNAADAADAANAADTTR